MSIRKSRNCRALMLDVCLRTSHTASLSFQSTVQNQSCSTQRITICFSHCPHRCRHSWFLGRSRETEVVTVKRWLSLHLQLLTGLTTTSFHAPPWTLPAQPDTPGLDITPVTCWCQLPDSFMTGSCERKNCMWLSIRLTLNIWDGAVKA